MYTSCLSFADVKLLLGIATHDNVPDPFVERTFPLLPAVDGNVKVRFDVAFVGAKILYSVEFVKTKFET